jgi:hypothetical protein
MRDPTPLSAFPYVTVRVGCDVCRRHGQFRLARLAARHGPEIDLEELIVKLSADSPAALTIAGLSVVSRHPVAPTSSTSPARRDPRTTAGNDEAPRRARRQGGLEPVDNCARSLSVLSQQTVTDDVICRTKKAS